MKKVLSIALALLMILALAACGTQTNQPAQTGNDTPTGNEPAAEATEITLWTYPVGSWGNEEAVKAFLDHKISFLGIERIINDCLKAQSNVLHPTYADLKKADLEARALANELIKKGGY